MTNEVVRIQEEVRSWVSYNFGNDNELATFGGLCEEAGEVMRAAVKRSQQIRGSYDEWSAEVRKECADVFIKLCDIANFENFDLFEAIQERWDNVRQRDWTVNQKGHGISS